MIVVHSFRSLQETFEARASEWVLTGTVLSLAVVFFINDEMFYRDSFQGMRSIIDDRLVWAFLCLIIGAIRLSVLFINGMYWRTPHFRAATAFMCAGIWFLFLISFMRNGSIMAAIMPWVFLLDAYNVKRASREAGKSEFIQRYVRKQGIRDAELAQQPNS